MKDIEQRKLIKLFGGSTVVIFIATVLSICVGKYSIDIKDIWNILIGSENVSLMMKKVFFTLRLPRTFMAIIAGFGLGLAGSVYQIIFKNPLASPDIIGIAGGANLGAALAIVLLSSSGMIGIAMGSFIGGFLAVMAVMFLVKATRSRATATYVLAGIVINSISKAVIMGLKYFADPENELAAMEYWEMGTLGNTTATKVMTIFPLFLVGVVGIILLHRQVEMLALSDNECRALGMRIGIVRTFILLLSTLLVSSIICVTGLISFVGLIAPHISKLILNRNNFTTIMLSSFIGSIVILIADIFARLLYSVELPISILTTIIGVPILIYFLCKKERVR
ncbi:MAG: iron ABC transporter permease [Finegoldia sp.]|nr:iron ABC transporter permease [Finegoldia sp.]